MWSGQSNCRVAFIGIMQKREQILHSDWCNEIHYSTLTTTLTITKLQYFHKPKDSGLWHQILSSWKGWVWEQVRLVGEEHLMRAIWLILVLVTLLDTVFKISYIVITKGCATRQMMIIAGGEPELRVGSMHVCMHYVCASLVQNAVCTCCTYVKRVCVEWTTRKTEVHESQGWWHRQGSASMKRFAGLSLIPASQFVARLSLLFAFPSSAFSVL